MWIQIPQVPDLKSLAARLPGASFAIYRHAFTLPTRFTESVYLAVSMIYLKHLLPVLACMAINGAALLNDFYSEESLEKSWKGERALYGN